MLVLERSEGALPFLSSPPPLPSIYVISHPPFTVSVPDLFYTGPIIELKSNQIPDAAIACMLTPLDALDVNDASSAYIV